MSKVIITKSKITSIGDKIRVKKGTTDKLTLDQIDLALDDMVIPAGAVEITENGEWNIAGYEKANVNVPASAFEDSIYGELNAMTFGEASGPTLTLNCDTYVLNDEFVTYSLDSGSTWKQFTSESIVLDNPEKIRFYCNWGSNLLCVGTSNGAHDISYLWMGNESEDIEITEDTTWYVTHESD